MDKKIRLLNYKDEPKEIIINDFEKVVLLVFEIKSGDGILNVVYKDHIETFDSDYTRQIGFDDGIWFINPEDFDVINQMKDHYDTDKLDEAMLKYGEKKEN